MVNSPGMAYEGRLYFLRDTTRDKTVYDNPTTVYTDSTTLTTGMILYDNTGTDTGLTVGTVNQDGTFDVVSIKTITLLFNASRIGTTVTINGTSPSSYLADYTWTIPVGSDVTIVCDGSKGCFKGWVTTSSNETYIPTSTKWNSDSGYLATISFVMPNEDLSFVIGDKLD